jgi:hypothetical protein
VKRNASFSKRLCASCGLWVLASQWIVHLCQKRPVERRRLLASVLPSQAPSALPLPSHVAGATAWPVPSGSSRVVLPGTHRPTRLPGCGVCERVSCSIVLSSGTFGTRVGSRPVYPVTYWSKRPNPYKNEGRRPPGPLPVC